MSGTRPERVLDPVCGMNVDVIKAEEAGLTIEHDGRTYAFCRSGFNLRTFFTATGIVLIFVAAGLVAFSIAEFGEAGWFSNAGTAINLDALLADSTPLGNVLRGLFGYRSQPTVLELAGYLLFLVPVLFLFVVDRPVRRRSTAIAN